MKRNRYTSAGVGLVAAALVAIGAGRTIAHTGQPGWHLPAEVNATDPNPGAGISYEWYVELIRGGHGSMTGAVGAESWHDWDAPAGLRGVTKDAHWIALDLVVPAKLVITLERQQGVLYNTIGGATMARGELTPALTLYRGWDETTDSEPANFDNDGDWAALEYLDHDANEKGDARIRYRTKLLPQGRYTIVVGGHPPDLQSYPAADCDPFDQVCYAYTGRHGYRLTLQAK